MINLTHPIIIGMYFIPLFLIVITAIKATYLDYKAGIKPDMYCVFLVFIAIIPFVNILFIVFTFKEMINLLKE